jgi:DNA-binding transcriptional regulator YiaG
MTGQHLRRTREAAGLSQKALAEAVGTTETTVWRWEHEQARITEPMARLLALVLKRPARAKGGRR